jgi:hypothetical protein
VTGVDAELQKPGVDFVSATIEFLEEMQKLLNGGTPRRIRVKFGGRTVKEVPVALGVAAALAVGALAVVISKTTIEIDRGEKDLEGNEKS